MTLNRLFVLTFALISLTSGLATAQAAQVSTLVPVSHVYSPKGFDTNDNTQVVVAGYLPNLCYKAQHAEATVDGKTISIKVTALWDQQLECPQMIVPFLETVNVGVLDKGNYKISVNGGTLYEAASEIAVVESTSSAIDDHVYASLDFIDRTAGSRKITLKGWNPSDCYAVDHVEYISNGSDTYSVLPIMKKVHPNCQFKMQPLSIETEVPATLPTDKVLLHVRIMDGKSINALFDNKE